MAATEVAAVAGGRAAEEGFVVRMQSDSRQEHTVHVDSRKHRLLHVVLKRLVRPGFLKKLVPCLPEPAGELV